jgi:hypothetical protein
MAQVAIIPLDESNVANARLIACAPEMLYTLIEFIKGFEIIEKQTGDFNRFKITKAHCISLIEKATGKKWETIGGSYGSRS